MAELRQTQIKKKLQPSLSEGFLEETCDKALVVGVSEKIGGPKTVSLLFSRKTLLPSLDAEAKQPFEMTRRFVASIAMPEEAAKTLALNILQGLGITSLEQEEKEASEDEA